MDSIKDNKILNYMNYIYTDAFIYIFNIFNITNRL